MLIIGGKYMNVFVILSFVHYTIFWELQTIMENPNKESKVEQKINQSDYAWH